MIRNGARFNFRGLRSSSSLLLVKSPGSPCRFTCFAAGFTNYAILGLSPFASKADVKYAYKRLALKFHPDVAKPDSDTFREIKAAYESIMQKMEEEEEEEQRSINSFDEWEDWDEWIMGCEGGIPTPTYSAF